MAEQEMDKTEEPTPFKLQQARRRGEVPKSMEWTSLFVLAGGLFSLQAFGPWMVHQTVDMFRSTLLLPVTGGLEAPALLAHALAFLPQVLFALSPLLFLGVLFAILGNLVQIGPVFAPEAITPKPQRLNPVEGLKRLFSRRAMFDFGKTVIKVVLFFLVLSLLLYAAMPQLMPLTAAEANALPGFFGELLMQFLYVMFALVAFTALLDLIFSRRDFLRRMRMSRRELKDEVKRREGDPHVRAKLKELQRELLEKSRGVSRVPDSDFVVVNPTSYAVAVRYDRATMRSPVVVAMGRRLLARRIVTIARRHGVPIIRHKQLARMLYRDGSIDAAIPEAAFPPVANIMAWAWGWRTNLQEGEAIA